MPIAIPENLRIKNKTAIPEPKDNTRKDADLIMRILDTLVDGGIIYKLPNWTTATRPSNPEIGIMGINTSFSPPQREWYDGSEWRID